MKIADLFRKDINRPINGVVKADQLDDASIWQELDEFVVTQELDKHLRTFFDRYCEGIDSPNDPDIAGNIGVWVSGFFGSGKSHFIKVLSHLLDNESHSFDGQTRKAVDFFEDKITDSMFLGDIKRAVASDTDVILFNIDSKADSSTGREAILAVFLKVLNEKLGYSPDHAHIAHLERYLDEKGQYEDFKEHYAAEAGHQWLDERDAYEFNRDEVISALSKTLGQSTESCEQWVDSGESNFSLTVENLAKWTKAYLDSKGPTYRLIFLVDEVGQFIGQDSGLMLNLQTITEQLGTVCKGRAWVMVTSQSDINAVLGDIKVSDGNDFSKIQGRFKTRLSLSSGNVDEVIAQRLLAKTESVIPELETRYQKDGDIINNQLSFSDIGTTYPRYDSAGDFAALYPFAPYQFKLLQRVFESIRKAGATGMHLAQGERSLLDAFQHAAMSIATEEVGVLVPLYSFYPSIQSFLDPGVKRTIDHATENRSLEPFDTNILQVLFLIRYVDEMKGNADNLVTLCLDRIDAPRLALKQKINDSLARLEKNSLISRNGDLYYFLTNEERDISREIKKIQISASEEAKTLGNIIFDDILREQRKHRYSGNGKDIPFNRLCDGQPVGHRTDGHMILDVISPLAEGYDLASPQKCTLNSSADGGKLILLLPNEDQLGRELGAWLQTDAYLKTQDDSTAAAATRSVHKALAHENQQRRTRLTEVVGDMLSTAQYFAAGQSLDPKAAGPVKMIAESLDYLVTNTFHKLKLLQHTIDEPAREMQAIIRSDDVSQASMDLNGAEANPEALKELHNMISLACSANRQVIFYDLCFDKFASRPYGWPEQQTALLLIRLYGAGKIRLQKSGAEVSKQQLLDLISKSATWRTVTIHERVTANPEDVHGARQLGRDVFDEMGPESEEALFGFLQAKLQEQQNSLNRYQELASNAQYPGLEQIEESQSLINTLLSADESNRFIQRFNDNKDALVDHTDHYSTLRTFYERQKPVWDKLLKASQAFQLNEQQLRNNPDAAKALDRTHTILKAPAPYGLIQETDKLLATVKAVNDQLLTAQREQSLQKIDSHLQSVEQELQAVGAENTLQRECKDPLASLRSKVAEQTSLAHITQAEAQALLCKDNAIAKIAEFAKKQADKANDFAKPAADGSPPISALSAFKPVKTISASSIQPTGYIETTDQVEDYLQKLRAQLLAAIDSGNRVEIR